MIALYQGLSRIVAVSSMEGKPDVGVGSVWLFYAAHSSLYVMDNY